jgi:hypothetical protein
MNAVHHWRDNGAVPLGLSVSMHHVMTIGAIGVIGT